MQTLHPNKKSNLLKYRMPLVSLDRKLKFSWTPWLGELFCFRKLFWFKTFLNNQTGPKRNGLTVLLWTRFVWDFRSSDSAQQLWLRFLLPSISDHRHHHKSDTTSRMRLDDSQFDHGDHWIDESNLFSCDLRRLKKRLQTWRSTRIREKRKAAQLFSTSKVSKIFICLPGSGNWHFFLRKGDQFGVTACIVWFSGVRQWTATWCRFSFRSIYGVFSRWTSVFL